MARTKKPEKVDTYRHEKSRVEVDIYLDRNTFEYYGEYLGKRYRNKAHDELIKELKETIEANAVLDWKPILYLKIHSHSASDQSISFSYERFLVADRNSRGGNKLKGGDYLKCQWIVDVQERKSEEELAQFEREHGREPYGFSERYHRTTYSGVEIPEQHKLRVAQEWYWEVGSNGPFRPPVRTKTWGHQLTNEIYIDYDERVFEMLSKLASRMREIETFMLEYFLDAEKLTHVALGQVGELLLGALPETTESVQEEGDDDDV